MLNTCFLRLEHAMKVSFIHVPTIFYMHMNIFFEVLNLHPYRKLDQRISLYVVAQGHNIHVIVLHSIYIRKSALRIISNTNNNTWHVGYKMDGTLFPVKIERTIRSGDVCVCVCWFLSTGVTFSGGLLESPTHTTNLKDLNVNNM